jgi:DNA-binding FadR family transcriptional regulator
MEIMRSPRVADVIANSVRAQILSGQLKEGDSLPRQEDMLARYDAGLPAVREALRILELEGLVSVRRGNLGGAVVHLPALSQVAYLSALVMQSRAAPLSDVADALGDLEPICAQLCAERPDRLDVVVPELKKATSALRDNLDSEPAAFNATAHEFHRALGNYCGNEALRVGAGSLIVVWSAHERAYTERARAAGTFPGRAGRIASCLAHERILACIEAGDGKKAAVRTRSHAKAVQEHHFSVGGAEKVTASALQAFYLPGS